VNSKEFFPLHSRPIEPLRSTSKVSRHERGQLVSNGQSFAEIMATAQNRSDVRVSAHAMQRMRDRGISLDADVLNNVSKAMDELRAKGAKESLVMCDHALLVVNVPNRTIITALDPVQSKNNVFTNIDSAIVI